MRSSDSERISQPDAADRHDGRGIVAAVGRDDLRPESCLILASRASGELTLGMHIYAGSLGLPRMRVYPRPG